MKAWRPVLTPRLVILLFSTVGIIFIPIGALIISVSNSVIEVVGDDYTGSCCIENCSADYEPWQRVDKNPCDVQITVPVTMQPPVYVYYKLTQFYQNHRRYVRSRDDKQLKGIADLTESQLSATSSCQYKVLANASDKTSVISPCGLVAWSVFNDSFQLIDAEGTGLAVDLNETGIAWPSDQELKFKNSENGSTGQNFPQFAHWRQRTCDQLPASATKTASELQNECLAFQMSAGTEAGWCFPGSGYCVEDEHFIVWMRAAGLPSFRKLYAKIESPLPAGTYTLRVSNGQWDSASGAYVNAATGGAPQTALYPVSSFGGTKALVLSTTSWIGGKNLFLGYAYVVVGVVTIVLALCFLIKQQLTKRDIADADYIQGPK